MVRSLLYREQRMKIRTTVVSLVVVRQCEEIVLMPTAILDLEYDCLPAAVRGLERYSAAQVLVRIGGQPAAWVRLPVENGQVAGQALLDAVRRQADHMFWQQLALHRLGLSPLPPAAVP